MLAVQQNKQGGDSNSNGNSRNRPGKNDDKRKSNFTKKNFFQKNQSFNFRNKGSKDSSSPEGQVQPQPQSNASFQPKIRSQTPSNNANTTTKASLLSNEEIALDNIIGGFNSSIPSQPKSHNDRSLPKFLLYQPPTLDASDFFNIDQWDRENQNKMENMESQTNDFTSIYEELQKMRENERSVMEKKGLVDNENIRRSLEDAIIFKGSCHDMCPVYERVRRSVENDVRIYEKDSNSGRISKLKAIKAFSRPAAGQPPPLPSDVRPPQILIQTLDHVIQHVLTALPEAQSFLWDRTRSIRQDFTYQNYLGPEAADCNEKIVRIHILTLHIMAETQTEYSQQQELEQMNKALKTLSEMYTEYRSRGIIPPNEAEFRAYYMLSQIRDPELEREVQALPIELLNDERIQLVLQLRNLVSMNIIERGFQSSENVLNSFTSFFDMINNKKIPVLMSFLLEIHLNEIRFYALRSMKKAIHNKARPYPLEMIQELLAFNDKADLVEFCQYYGIIISPLEDGLEGIDILSLKYNSHLIPDQKPLKQSFSNKLNSVIGSYESLINAGQTNTGLIKFDGLNTTTTPTTTAAITSGAGTNFNFMSQNPIPSSSLSSAFPTQTNTQPIFPPVSSTTSAFQFPSATTATTTQASVIPQISKEQLDKERREKEEQEQIKLLKQKEKEEEQRLKEIEIAKVKEQELELQNMRKTMLEKQEVKKQQKSQIVNSLGDYFQKSIISNVINEEVSNIVQPLVRKKKAIEKQKTKLIDAFSDGIYEAFVNELIYFESLKLMSDFFEERQLKKKIISKISKVAKNCKQESDLKKRKREELKDVIENFGVPRIIKKKKLRKNSSYSEISNISTSTSIGSIPTPKSKSQVVDLRPFEFKQLINELNKEGKKYNVLLYVEDSIISRLFNKKFNLVNDVKSFEVKDKEVLRFQKTSRIDSSLFNHLNLLVFNIVEMKNFESKKLELRELLQGIQLNNNYKFEILVIYWELNQVSKDSLIEYNQLEILQNLNIPKNDNILKVNIIKVDSNLNLFEIENFFNKIGEIELSAKGNFNERYNKNNIQLKESNNKPPFIGKKPINSIQYPSQFDIFEDSKISKKFKPHIEASVKYKKLPKLLSDQNHKISKPSSSITSGINPTTVQKLQIYQTPRPKSSDLAQTPSYYDSSSLISNISNVTFETKEKEDMIIKKPIMPSSSSSSSSVSNTSNGSELILKKSGKTIDGMIIPKSIQELRDLTRSIKEKHEKKKNNK